MNNMKKYVDTYLYTKGNYEEPIFTAIMKYDRIDKNAEAFKAIEYDVKRRQTTNVLVKVLASPKLVLIHNKQKPLSKAFKVFAAKDVKNDKALTVFVDVSDIIVDNKGEWKCIAIDVLVARLVSAMTNFIYYTDHYRFSNNSRITTSGAIAFSKLFVNIVDYLYKITTDETQKAVCSYLAVKYFLVNIMEKDPKSDSVKNLAARISKLGEAKINTLSIYEEDDTYENIKNFIETVAQVLKINKLQLDNFTNKWLTLYGTGTHFALEIFPSFAEMITDTYANAYINKQKTIEKVIGDSLIEFTRATFAVGNTYFN